LDVEPSDVDSDHDLAFRSVGGAKRALVLVYTDLVDEAAARSLVDAVPVLARRHAVIVASVRDPDLDAAVRTPPSVPHDVCNAAVPSTISTAARASSRNACPRSRVPGSTIADASRNPATPATAMQLISSTPCATTSSKNGRPFPAPIARPATAPSSTPLYSSTYKVPIPRRRPPPN